jgi:hypothetical protein
VLAAEAPAARRTSEQKSATEFRIPPTTHETRRGCTDQLDVVLDYIYSHRR